MIVGTRHIRCETRNEVRRCTYVHGARLAAPLSSRNVSRCTLCSARVATVPSTYGHAASSALHGLRPLASPDDYRRVFAETAGSDITVIKWASDGCRTCRQQPQDQGADGQVGSSGSFLQHGSGRRPDMLEFSRRARRSFHSSSSTSARSSSRRSWCHRAACPFRSRWAQRPTGGAPAAHGKSGATAAFIEGHAARAQTARTAARGVVTPMVAVPPDGAPCERHRAEPSATAEASARCARAAAGARGTATARAALSGAGTCLGSSRLALPRERESTALRAPPERRWHLSALIVARRRASSSGVPPWAAQASTAPQILAVGQGPRRQLARLRVLP